MRQGIWILIALIFVVGWSSCRSERPNYKLGELQGQWRRISSTNVDADSMILEIRGNKAIILDVPSSSSFVVNEEKWTDIKEVVSPKNFTLFDKSADSDCWEAAIFVENHDGDRILQFRLESINFLDAPGGKQRWVRE